MKVISWNVNGIRSALRQGFCDWVSQTEADLICLQETKISLADLEKHVPEFAGYATYWHAAEKKGYSGVAIITKQPALSVRYGIGVEAFDHEGRVITLEFETLYVVNTYVPNAKSGFERIGFRLAWDTAFRTYLGELRKNKPVIVCGDFNAAHTDLDIGIPDAEDTPGCSPMEQDSFSKLLTSGFTDSFRALHPETRQYSWWSYAGGARAWNAGIRFDYILVSNDLASVLRAADTHRETIGSDHGPVSLVLDHEFGTGKPFPPITASGQIGFGI